jgi:hypothetical protein
VTAACSTAPDPASPPTSDRLAQDRFHSVCGGGRPGGWVRFCGGLLAGALQDGLERADLLDTLALQLLAGDRGKASGSAQHRVCLGLLDLFGELVHLLVELGDPALPLLDSGGVSADPVADDQSLGPHGIPFRQVLAEVSVEIGLEQLAVALSHPAVVRRDRFVPPLSGLNKSYSS